MLSGISGFHENIPVSKSWVINARPSDTALAICTKYIYLFYTWKRGFIHYLETLYAILHPLLAQK